ncbi:MAG: carboxypeptidase-like regulatory domain-containing protein [Flavobacteriales bacterium]|nr:carboxypeptidase-like regulatory domain-containing protein [Flavobacteriales bacterium]
MAFYHFIKNISCLICLLGGAFLNAQELKDCANVSFSIVDDSSDELLPYATVIIFDNKEKSLAGITDNNGYCIIKNIPKGDGILKISYVGYSTYQHEIYIDGNKSLKISLKKLSEALPEVVITASESKGVTSSSKIERKAMEHLQPSSFADILELIPGGYSKDPSLSSPNIIHLREVPISNYNYSTSSLGTSFVIDGAPISTNANLQTLAGAWETSATSRDFVNMGLDMRTISTDDIKSVEIVRGIPSVEYGDLTSGLVKIERKRGGNDTEARFKADMKSKLFYVGKGFDFSAKKLSVNIGVDYLDSKADPRNNLENYKRLSFSIRTRKEWNTDGYTIALNSALDYSGSFDNEKTDPELNYGNIDTYSSSYNRLSLNNALNIKNTNPSFFKSFNLNTSVSFEKNTLDRTKLVQLQRDTPIPNSTTEGEHDGIFLPYKYTATQSVDGRPFNFFAKATTTFGFKTENSVNNTLIGTDINIDKNFGQGQIYDTSLPPYPSMTTRPRTYSSIPARYDLAFFIQQSSSVKIGSHSLDVMAGVRALTMLNIPASYTMRGSFYLDPRINVKWGLPVMSLGGRAMKIDFSAGVGSHTKTPTLDQLYPDMVYCDLVQLNYYHTNPEYRRINMMTYIIDPTNTSLSPATNVKWEVRSDVSFGQNRLSVTYFQENMNSGFRYTSGYDSFTYKKYDASGIDHSALTSKPSLTDMPYVIDTILYGHTSVTNGSGTFKEGVEFSYSSPRWEKLHTRLTITGAWFKTTYQNSQPVYEKPSVVLDGEQIQYVGVYSEDDGYIRESFNTNFLFDTDMPRLGLGFSLSLQCMWFTASQTAYKSGVPIAYLDPSGTEHPFTEQCKEDTYLKWLVKTYSSSLFQRSVVPFGMNINLKVTKKIMKEKMMLAIFVNKIMDYHPDYTSNGLTVRRNVTPYFGMEINFKL